MVLLETRDLDPDMLCVMIHPHVFNCVQLPSRFAMKLLS